MPLVTPLLVLGLWLWGLGAVYHHDNVKKMSKAERHALQEESRP